MGIRSDRRWGIDLPAVAVWDALTSTDRYRRWWPWLHELEDAEFVTGASWRCTVAPPLPYRIRFELRLVAVEEGARAAAELSGDVTGPAELTLERLGPDRCILRLQSHLEAARGPAAAVGRWLPALAAFSHDLVVDDGLRRFRRELERR